MIKDHIGNLIKYNEHFWLIERVVKGEAELWRDGKCRLVPLDDLDVENIVTV